MLRVEVAAVSGHFSELGDETRLEQLLDFMIKWLDEEMMARKPKGSNIDPKSLVVNSTQDFSMRQTSCLLEEVWSHVDSVLQTGIHYFGCEFSDREVVFQIDLFNSAPVRDKVSSLTPENLLRQNICLLLLQKIRVQQIFVRLVQHIKCEVVLDHLID